MTIVRNEQEALPPLARRLGSEEGVRLILRRLLWVYLIALAPMLVLGVGHFAFFDEIEDAYLSGTEVWGWPVVAIGEDARGWISIGRRAVGAVAIGRNLALGVIAISPTVAIGLVSVSPLLCLGVVSFGFLAIGIWSLGIVTLGLASQGIFSIARLAFGRFAVGWYAVGDVAVAAYAWGRSARGFFRAESRIPTPQREPPSGERLLFPNWQKKGGGKQ